MEAGKLGEGDNRLDSGEYFDLFSIEASAGDSYVIDLSSRDFDTYLIIRSAAVEASRPRLQ